MKIITYMEENTFEIAVKTGTGVVSVLMACWADVHLLFVLTFTLLLVDNVVAVYRAFLQRKKGVRWFEYRQMRKTIEKFISYAVAIVVARIIEYIVGTDFGLYKFVAGYIAIYEGISIFSHLGHITGYTLFTDVVDWLKNHVNWKKYFNK